MANSINVIQNKWAHITQLEGRSSRCTGPAAATASTGSHLWVRGAPCSWWGSVQQLPHRACAGGSCPEAVLQCYKWAGKANKGLCVAQVVHLALSLMLLLALFAGSRVLDPYCHTKGKLVSLFPGELRDRVLPPTMHEKAVFSLQVL